MRGSFIEAHSAYQDGPGRMPLKSCQPPKTGDTKAAMQTADRDFFFETDALQAQRRRKAVKAANRLGNPLQMKSKLLAAVLDSSSPCASIFVAESTGNVRRVHLESREPQTTYRGPKAPVTDLSIGGKGDKTIFASSWDKHIWSWDIESGRLERKYGRHADFVKTVVCARLSGREILISGGADKKIIVWNIETGQRIHTLQDSTTTMLAIQHIAIDPMPNASDVLVIVSASSDPFIRRWKITLDGYAQLPQSSHERPGAERLGIQAHATSVYKLVFDSESEGCNMWTASADGTAKCLARARDFAVEDSLTHGDHLRTVLVTKQWVMTAGRDENIKIWDKAQGKLYFTLEGHFEEVTDLVLLSTDPLNAPQMFCSVSIDGTVRTWPLSRSELEKTTWEALESAEREDMETAANDEDVLTAEEKAELVELMDDSLEGMGEWSTKGHGPGPCE